MMTEPQIVQFLKDTGHLEFPFGEKDPGPWPVTALDMDSKQVQRAVESFQTMHAPVLERIVAKHYPERPSPTVKVDGEVGPATMELMQAPRCQCPDYGEAMVEQAVGSGNWKRCWQIGEFHAAVVKFDTSGVQAFLKPILDEVWSRVVAAYDELGLHFIRRDDATNPNIDVSFVVPDSGWIGLAIVGQGQTCSSRIWARFDKSYQPANVLSEWTTLIKHELGHNCGLQHSSGGVMNPYIIKGLPVSWKGDVSYPLLTARFGGVAIPSAPKERELVIAWRYADGSYEKVMDVPVGATTGPFPTGL